MFLSILTSGINKCLMISTGLVDKEDYSLPPLEFFTILLRKFNLRSDLTIHELKESLHYRLNIYMKKYNTEMKKLKYYKDLGQYLEEEYFRNSLQEELYYHPLSFDNFAKDSWNELEQLQGN